MEGGPSLFGLGFSAPGNHADESASTTSTAADKADSLMQQYLQQCIVYHHDQEERNHQQQEKEQQSETSHNLSDGNSATIQFVAAQQQPQQPLPPVNQEALPPTLITQTLVVQESYDVPATTSSSSEITNSTYQAAQEAMAKARAIVQKFQTQQKHHQQQNISTISYVEGAMVDNTTITPHISPMEYRHQREQFYIKEKQRFHEATLKNFEYVAKKEEQRYERQLQQIEQTKNMELQLNQHQSNILQQRQQSQLKKQQNFSTKAGIGTARRQQLESSKQQKGHAIKVQQQQGITIYVSGLPADGSIQQVHLQQLFSSYGPIQKIHLYRNKRTNQMKGDGLIVYEDNFGEDGAIKKETLLDTVCSQMTGAELACGSVLKVEPADSKYKSKQTSKSSGDNISQSSTLTKETAARQDVGYYGPSSSETAIEVGKLSNDHPVSDSLKNDAQVEEPDKDEELDDFFASL